MLISKTTKSKNYDGEKTKLFVKISTFQSNPLISLANYVFSLNKLEEKRTNDTRETRDKLKT